MQLIGRFHFFVSIKSARYAGEFFEFAGRQISNGPLSELTNSSFWLRHECVNELIS